MCQDTYNERNLHFAICVYVFWGEIFVDGEYSKKNRLIWCTWPKSYLRIINTPLNSKTSFLTMISILLMRWVTWYLWFIFSYNNYQLLWQSDLLVQYWIVHICHVIFNKSNTNIPYFVCKIINIYHNNRMTTQCFQIW